LSLTTAMDRVSEVQEPFYRRALNSTRSKLGSNQVSGAMLERARQTLGIDEETAFDMHVACFNEEVRDQLGLKIDEVEDDETGSDAKDIDLSTAKFREGSKVRVSPIVWTVKCFLLLILYSFWYDDEATNGALIFASFSLSA